MSLATWKIVRHGRNTAMNKGGEHLSIFFKVHITFKDLPGDVIHEYRTA